MPETDALNGLDWKWIAIAATVPPIVGVLLALPFWRKLQMIFGNILGTTVLFGAGFGFIFREYVVLDRITQACLDAGDVCWPTPSAFTRFAIYAFIALIEVFALFSVSLTIEERIRRRDYSPEWR